ncbi:uncharacterized protein LOC125494924 [Beta vulgaris subsp. vulgaris]|uniref:uncharacterized protein LOC125494924 n=1 Tax=Beta vulgaris subsp. vulgaris TaxID=3555 RepID=UPI0025476215|nr:uncharacterized protein LOC125494924 [Beta vulgaris subsp. vulgaris]
MTATWIAKNYKSKFKINPYLRLQDIIETVWLEWGIRVSRGVAYRARRRGQSLIVGEYMEQYTLLPRYAAEIKKSNPGNTVIIKMDGNIFERMYICFEALKKGFIAGCRPFISLDGCFLKGPYGGQLLVAVGRDGNNQMFPIAWAVVEVESTSSWTWFLTFLGEDLLSNEGAGYTFMSDQQKGLLKAVSDVFPQAESRVCARHVYCNFRGVFGGGLEYRKQFWIMAKSTTENEFFLNLEKMRIISNAAADDLLNRNYKKWCRAFYTPLSCCDSVDNNMSEVFNAYILNSRHKPIITMLEDIREGIMERLHKKRDEIGKKRCCCVQEYNSKLRSTRLVLGDGMHSGMGVVAIWNKVDQPEHYVNPFFTKSVYLKAYDYLLEPINGAEEWPSSETLVNAPKLKKVHNRRQVKRRKAAGVLNMT